MNDKKNRIILFCLSCLAYLTIGFHFSIRSSIAGDLANVFGRVDAAHSSEMVGAALGVCFLGYAITMFFISPLIDAIGMGLLMRLSGILLILGTAVVIATEAMMPDSLYAGIWGGMLLVGLGWGLVDTITNPLVAAMYPDDKVHKLNVIHAWWPAGIVLGGLTGIVMGSWDVAWQIKLAVTAVPAIALIVLCFMAKFPLTERVTMGVSFGDMFKELIRRPMFWIWFVVMMFTATSELAPGQWVDMTLTRTVGMRGIWILIYISGLMFVLRHFAGSLVHKLSAAGLMWFSCLFAAGGLLWLSVASNPVGGFLAATVWGAGVCFMWPTMLATVNERYPKTGALGMGLLGSGATLAIYFFLPLMGKVYDSSKIETAGGEESFMTLSGEGLDEVLAIASQESFRIVAILPAVLLVVFGLIWFYDSKRRKLEPAKRVEAS